MVARGNSIGKALLQYHPETYVCRSCRNNLRRTGVTAQQKRFVSGDVLPLCQTNQRSIKTDGHLSIPSNVHTSRNAFQKRQIQTHARTTPVVQEQSFGRTPGPDEQQAVSATSKEYKPAETWDGLEHVGYDGNWRNIPSQPIDTFSAWLDLSAEPVRTRESTISCLHQAIVECLLCDEAGLDSSSAAEVETTKINRDAYASAEIVVSEAGLPVDVKFTTETQRQGVIDALVAGNRTIMNRQQEAVQEVGEIEEGSEGIDMESEVQNAEEIPTSSLPARNNALHYPVQDQSFLNLRLDVENPVTFTIFKRFSQLTGNRIPDPAVNAVLSSNKPLSFLIEQFYHSVVQPKPTKLVDILMKKPNITSQSNLMVFPRRETPVDKQKEVGRWKIIEKELHERGLPSLSKLHAR